MLWGQKICLWFYFLTNKKVEKSQQRNQFFLSSVCLFHFIRFFFERLSRVVNLNLVFSLCIFYLLTFYCYSSVMCSIWGNIALPSDLYDTIAPSSVFIAPTQSSPVPFSSLNSEFSYRFGFGLTKLEHYRKTKSSNGSSYMPFLVFLKAEMLVWYEAC